MTKYCPAQLAVYLVLPASFTHFLFLKPPKVGKSRIGLNRKTSLNWAIKVGTRVKLPGPNPDATALVV